MSDTTISSLSLPCVLAACAEKRDPPKPTARPPTNSSIEARGVLAKLEKRESRLVLSDRYPEAEPLENIHSTWSTCDAGILSPRSVMLRGTRSDLPWAARCCCCCCCCDPGAKRGLAAVPGAAGEGVIQSLLLPWRMACLPEEDEPSACKEAEESLILQGEIEDCREDALDAVGVQ